MRPEKRLLIRDLLCAFAVFIASAALVRWGIHRAEQAKQRTLFKRTFDTKHTLARLGKHLQLSRNAE